MIPNPTKIICLSILILALIQLWNSHITSQNTAENSAQKPKFKYLLFREDCFTEFLNLNFLYKDCIAITLSKFFGYLIILAAGAVKVPQLLRILKNKSGKGILPSTFIAECLMYIIKGCYAAHLGSAFSVYGENLLMFIQSFVIINLLWSYEKSTTLTTKIGVTLLLFGLTFFLYSDRVITDGMWKILINWQIFFSGYSRIPQIYHNFSTKSTGELSFTSFSMNALGNFVRLLTVLKEVKDPFYIMTSIISFTFNATIWIQIKMYKDKEKKGAKNEKNMGDQGSKANSHSYNTKIVSNGGASTVRRRNKTT